MIPSFQADIEEDCHGFSHPSFIRGNKVSCLSLERNQAKNCRISCSGRRASLNSTTSSNSSSSIISQSSLPNANCMSNTSTFLIDTSNSTSVTQSWDIPIGFPENTGKTKVADLSVSTSDLSTFHDIDDLAALTLEPICYISPSLYDENRNTGNDTMERFWDDSSCYMVDLSKYILFPQQQQRQYMSYDPLALEPRPIEQMLTEVLI
jgi:hypothetical protein